jgi:hypothetical protein
MIRSLAIALSIVVALPAFADDAPRVTALEWMSGAWSVSSGTRVVEEMWTRPAGGTMIGAGRTVGGGTTKFFEFLRIVEKDGTLVYVAMPKGSSTTEFAMSKLGASSVTFSNPKHDFPQHITYRRDGAKLCAKVEGTGEPAEEWCYEPVAR